MPQRQATTTRTTKPASTPRATSKPPAKSRAASTDATIRKVVQQEQAKGSRQTTTKVTSTTNRSQKARTNGKPAIEFFEMTLAADVYLAGGDDKTFDITVCSRCGSLLPDSPASKKLHLMFHEAVARMEQQTS